MKQPPRKDSGFTLMELLVCFVVIGVLIMLVLPRWATIRDSGTSMTGALSNARQLHLATQTMALNTYSVGGEGMEWTMLASHGKTVPASLTAYFDALVKNNYLNRKDLTKLLTAPGKRPTENDLTVSKICFKFFQIDGESPSDQPFLVTVNWQPTGLTDDAPYGKKYFVVFAKGGSGGIYKRPADVTSTKLFPSGSEHGHPYRYITLK